MRVRLLIFLIFVLVCGLARPAFSTSKTQVISFGKWTNVQWWAESGAPDEKPVPLKIRTLIVDERVKEFTTGPAHEITDRLFAVRRVFRVNDSLPDETKVPSRWQWQQGGWLLVDRATGRLSSVNLPEFDPVYSVVSWYRDYASYCGVSDDGKKVYAMVAQVSRRKPILKKLIEGKSMVEGEAKSGERDSACALPSWQRAPARVSFEQAAGKETFVIRGHVADLVTETEENDEATNRP
jgi:hypothetical protein